MMEPVEFPAPVVPPARPDWAVAGNAETRRNLVSSIFLEPDKLEAHIMKLEAKYKRAEREAVQYEDWRTEDAEIVLVGYGIVSRILKQVVEQGRARGMSLGLLRPISLYPFPGQRLRELSRSATKFLVVELSTGQLVEDVRLSLEGRRPVEFYGRSGGNVPSAEEILQYLETITCQVPTDYTHEEDLVHV